MELQVARTESWSLCVSPWGRIGIRAFFLGLRPQGSNTMVISMGSHKHNNERVSSAAIHHRPPVCPISHISNAMVVVASTPASTLLGLVSWLQQSKIAGHRLSGAAIPRTCTVCYSSCGPRLGGEFYSSLTVLEQRELAIRVLGLGT